MNNPQKKKRPRSSIEENNLDNTSLGKTLEQQISENATPAINPTIIKKKVKRLKKRQNKKQKIIEGKKQPYEEEKTEILHYLQPLQQTLSENNHPYNFTPETLTEFILSMKYAPSPTMEKYIENIEPIVNTLTDLYPLLTHHKIKYRFTRIKNTLLKAFSQATQTENETSNSEQEEQSEY